MCEDHSAEFNQPLCSEPVWVIEHTSDVLFGSFACNHAQRIIPRMPPGFPAEFAEGGTKVQSYKAAST